MTPCTLLRSVQSGIFNAKQNARQPSASERQRHLGNQFCCCFRFYDFEIITVCFDWRMGKSVDSKRKINAALKKGREFINVVSTFRLTAGYNLQFTTEVTISVVFNIEPPIIFIEKL